MGWGDRKDAGGGGGAAAGERFPDAFGLVLEVFLGFEKFSEDKEKDECFLSSTAPLHQNREHTSGGGEQLPAFEQIKNLTYKYLH